MTWFRVGGAGIPASLKNNMNSVLNKKFGTSGQNYPPKGWPDDVNLLGPLPEKTVAGGIAHTDDAADTVPVKSVICSIVPKQAGTGTPSPSNPRAISGAQGMTLTQLRKNISSTSAYPNNPHTFWGTNYTEFVSVLNALPAGTYTASYKFKIVEAPSTGDVQYANFYIRALINGNYQNLTPYSIITKTGVQTDDIIEANVTFTIEDAQVGNIAYSYIYCDRANDHSAQTGRGKYALIDVQLEVGSSASSFEAYSEVADVSDSWSSIGTIYGGERDLTEGTLKKTHEYISSYNGEAINEPWISSIDEYVPGTTPSTGAQVVYPLTTPVNYSNLSTYDFETLYAVNNFYSDIEVGQTQLTYRQDIALALAALQGSRSLSASLMRSTGPEEVSKPEENIQNTEEEQEGENDAR
jgi:hypothetical protein